MTPFIGGECLIATRELSMHVTTRRTVLSLRFVTSLCASPDNGKNLYGIDVHAPKQVSDYL